MLSVEKDGNIKMTAVIQDEVKDTQIRSLLKAQQELSKVRALPLDDDSALEIISIQAHIVVMIERLEGKHD